MDSNADAPVPETRRTFHEQLEEIRSDVVKVAAKACEQIGAATQAILDADLLLVERIYAEHEEIAARVVQVEQRVNQLFALQQPMATDLRELLAVLRILHEIELTAGLMRNVARATRRLYPRELPPRVRGIIERMGAQASVQTHLAVDAFADNDAAVASALPDMDDVMDDLQKELFRAIFAGFGCARRVRAPDGGAARVRRPRLRTRRRPRGDDRPLGRVHGDRRTPGADTDSLP